MNLGEKLIELRKAKHLSQEEVAFKLNVTRQTISKWETNQSTPDFDKINPLCELYGITPNELLTGEIVGNNQPVNRKNTKKRAQGIGLAVLLFFISVIWLMISIPFLKINPIVGTAVFLLICGVAVYIIIYTSITYKQEKNEVVENKLFNSIEKILSILTVCIYLLVSFLTGAWHITWIIWIIYALIIEVVKLTLDIKEDKDEK